VYVALKFLHIVAVILWIGPPLGAYYLVDQAHRRRDEATFQWCQMMSERVLVIEHIAFVVLIATGVFIVQQSDWALLAVPWMRKKLLCVAAVLLFEIYDIWYSHFFVRRHLAGTRERKILTGSASLVTFVLIPLILWFAISKQ
jgi:uncharacterized membrane protein